jgi:hypothetical protein
VGDHATRPPADLALAGSTDETCAWTATVPAVRAVGSSPAVPPVGTHTSGIAAEKMKDDRDAERRSTVWRLRGSRTAEPSGEGEVPQAPGPLPCPSGAGATATPIPPDLAACNDPDHDRLARLREGLGAVRASQSGGVLSAARAVDPLLELRSLAIAVDRSAARPIERLLSTLIARSVTTSGELSACLDEVEETLARLCR